MPTFHTFRPFMPSARALRPGVVLLMLGAAALCYPVHEPAAAASKGDAAAAKVASAGGSTHIPPSAERWVPSEARMLLRVRTSEMRSSSLMRHLVESRPLFHAELEHVDRFALRAGTALGRGIDLVTVASDGRAGGESVALLEGTFEPAAIGERLASQGATKLSCGDTDCWAIPASKPGPGTKPAAGRETIVGMLQRGRAFVGSRTWVRSALDRWGAGAASDAKPSGPLAGLLPRLDPKASIWSAGTGADFLSRVRKHADGDLLDAADLGTVRSLVASFRVTERLFVDSEAATASTSDAGLLAATLKGLVAVSGLQASMSDPELADSLRTIRVEPLGQSVRIRANLSGPIARRL